MSETTNVERLLGSIDAKLILLLDGVGILICQNAGHRVKPAEREIYERTRALIEAASDPETGRFTWPWRPRDARDLIRDAVEAEAGDAAAPEEP